MVDVVLDEFFLVRIEGIDTGSIYQQDILCIELYLFKLIVCASTMNLSFANKSNQILE